MYPQVAPERTQERRDKANLSKIFRAGLSRDRSAYLVGKTKHEPTPRRRSKIYKTAEPCQPLLDELGYYAHDRK